MASLVPIVITLLLFSASLLLTLVALNLPPSNRPILLILIVVTALSAFYRIQTITFYPDHAQVIGLFILIWLSHISSLLCIERYILPRGSSDASTWEWHGAYKMLFNGRWIGASKSALVLPNEALIISRRTFLVRRLLSILTISLTYYLYTSILPTLFNIHPLHPTDFSPSKQTYFRRLFRLSGALPVTTRETSIRIFIVVHFILSNFAIFTILHAVLSILFVSILGLDAPADWPPLFGPYTTATTLHGFWKRFWHRIVYRSYLSYSALFLRQFLRIRPHTRTATTRALNILLMFLFTGLTHAFVSWHLGHRCGIWEEVWWFLLNAFALMVEDVVMGAVAALNRRGLLSFLPFSTRPFPMRLLRAVLGYTWVFLFFFWSMPKAQYPRHYCG